MSPDFAQPGPALRHLVVLSPHRDDAAFSCGLLLTLAAHAHLDCTILNLFTVSSYAPYAAAASTGAITRLRHEEDLALVRFLGTHIRLHDLSLSDAPLRLSLPVDQVLADSLPPAAFVRATQSLATSLRAAVAPAAGLILAPLALGDHIDHRLVRDAARLAFDPCHLGFYQDLPYAGRRSSGDGPIAPPADTVPLLLTAPDAAAVKQRLAAFYPSQIAHDVTCEIAAYTRALGGEQLYLPPSAAALLHSALNLLPESAS